MPLTRTNKKKAFRHIVKNVLDPDHEDTDMKLFIIEAFSKAKFSTIVDLISTNDTNISKLDYIDDDNNVVTLAKVPISILQNFNKYVQHLLKEGNENTFQSLEDWTKINVDDFDDFRVSLVNLDPTTSTEKEETPLDHQIDESSLDYFLDHILELHDDHPFEAFLIKNNIFTMSELLDFINKNDEIIFTNCGLTTSKMELLFESFEYYILQKISKNPIGLCWRNISCKDILHFSSPTPVASNNTLVKPTTFPPEVTKMINNTFPYSDVTPAKVETSLSTSPKEENPLSTSSTEWGVNSEPASPSPFSFSSSTSNDSYTSHMESIQSHPDIDMNKISSSTNPTTMYINSSHSNWLQEYRLQYKASTTI